MVVVVALASAVGEASGLAEAEMVAASGVALADATDVVGVFTGCAATEQPTLETAIPSVSTASESLRVIFILFYYPP